MPRMSQSDGPRHLAGRPHRSAHPTRGGAAPAPTTPVELVDAEAAPAVRVSQRRFAVALAATVLALPIVVLDNFPATADTADHPLAKIEVAAPQTSTSTTEAPTTTVAPTTTEAPTTTVAPTTTTTRAPARVVAVVKPTTTTSTTQPPSYAYGDPRDPDTWDRMAQCEAGGNWAANTGNGYYGGLQFSLGTWQNYGGTGYPHQASKATQIEIGKRLQAAKGWAAWPGCSAELGYS